MSEARRFIFPYCIVHLEDGRFIVLNRNYKPLGVQTEEWVDYDQHPSAIRLAITPAVASKLSWNRSDSIDRIYLYDDGCVPTDSADHMKAYLERIAVLMAVKRQE